MKLSFLLQSVNYLSTDSVDLFIDLEVLCQLMGVKVKFHFFGVAGAGCAGQRDHPLCRWVYYTIKDWLGPVLNISMSIT